MDIFHFTVADGKLMLDGNDDMRCTVTEREFHEYLGLIGDGEEGLKLWERQLSESIDIPEGTSLVVLNANPFTIGHRYLVSIARSRSRHTLVLVIQGRPESGGNAPEGALGFRREGRCSRRCICTAPPAGMR